MKRIPSIRMLGAATSVIAVLAAPAAATNGMYLAGYGSEAAGRAGTNLAIADRSLGLQANPAGIAQLQGQHFGVDAQFLAPSLRYGGDPFGNAMDGKNRVFTMPSLSYVRGAHKSPWTWGIGLISQGGMGATFEKYATPFGTRDQTSSEVRYVTASPAVAYSLTEDVSLGAALNLGYSDVTFSFWPRTSYYNDNGTPADPTDDLGFFGARLSKRARAWNTSARVGAMARVLPALTFGAIYETETQGDYTHGTLSLDQSAIGLGTVKYDAKVEGFTWPAQFGAGVQIRPAERWIVASDVRRYLWKHAMKTITVTGTSPDKASPMTKVTMPFTFDWRDEWVTSIGAEYRATASLTARGGWNYGRSPVPGATLNPLFPAITEQHATVGLGWTVRGNTMNFALERAFASKTTNRNTDPNVNPFGPGEFVEHSQWTLSLGFSKAFSR